MIGAHPIDESIPGYDKYRQAVARENLIRAAACLNLTERICGVEVMPLTPYHLRFLTLSRSPFLAEGATGAILKDVPGITESIIAFLWIVSPSFRAGMAIRQKRKWYQRRNARERFHESLSPLWKMDGAQICQDILDYVDEACIDAESGGTQSETNYFSSEVAIANELYDCYRYRIDFWNDEPRISNPVHVPFKLLLQLRKARAKYGDPKAAVTNKSERILMEGVAQKTEWN